MVFPPCSEPDDDGYLTGQLLIAMPNMPDSRFSRAVIYICAHTADGAMGLVINQHIPSVHFSELLEQLELLPENGEVPDLPLHFGGPVENGRGFVLHSSEYACDGSMQVNEDFTLTATIDILRDLAAGTGPEKSLLALGYAGWGPGQLDQEITANGWLSTWADADLVFDREIEKKWDDALHRIGISPLMLSMDAGHA